MRLKFKKSKQKELITNFKKENNFTWKQFSDFLNVKEGALAMWYYETRLLPLDIYKKLDKDNTYKNYIIEIKKENWGQSKGGLNSDGSLKKISIPKKSKELAELVGIILGDGNIHSYKKGKKIGVYSLRIAGHSLKDRKYHLKYIKPLCESLFNIKAKVINLSYKNERFVVLYSRKLVEYLERIGLKSGDKIKNQIGIPNWIAEDKNLLKACLRGLIDTDGSIFRMSRKDPNLIRISFTNFNLTLLKNARESFIKLGFHPSKITSTNKFYISRKKDIVRYINEIGFSNDKHIKRFREFNSLVV